MPYRLPRRQVEAGWHSTRAAGVPTLMGTGVFSRINRRLAWTGFIVGLLLFAAGIGVAFLPESNAQSSPTVNRAPFNEEIGNGLLSRMPDKSKEVMITSVGGPADQQVGNEVELFLKNHGYTVKRTIVFTYKPPPDHPFTIDTDNPELYRLIVAPSAH